jgi:hypothetical protein
VQPLSPNEIPPGPSFPVPFLAPTAATQSSTPGLK